MSTIVDELKVGSKSFPKDYTQLLQKVGFHASVEPTLDGYFHISTEAIFKLLRKRAGNSFWIKFIKQQGYGVGTLSLWIQRKYFVKDLSIDWNEEPIELYVGTPPLHVLSALEKAQELKLFEHYSVCTIKISRHIPDPDPILVGYRGKDRFLIDWWDKDIDPTDLIK